MLYEVAVAWHSNNVKVVSKRNVKFRSYALPTSKECGRDVMYVCN